jgi:hypothetical protein
MKIDREEIEALLFDYFDEKFQFSRGYYYKFESFSRTFITYSNLDFKNTELYELVGTIILEIRGSAILIFPSILAILKNIDDLIISPTQIPHITRGKSVNYGSSQKGLFRLLDHDKKILGLGRLSSNQLLPISDVGIYLREEDN